MIIILRPFTNLDDKLCRELLSKYRELCQKKQKATMKLQMSLEQAMFSESQKQSMLDANNNDSTRGMCSLEFIFKYYLYLITMIWSENLLIFDKSCALR